MKEKLNKWHIAIIVIGIIFISLSAFHTNTWFDENYSVAIAKQTGAKILPFAIKGKYKIFRKGVEIEFGKPIDISNMEVEEANDFVKNEVLKILRK